MSDDVTRYKLIREQLGLDHPEWLVEVVIATDYDAIQLQLAQAQGEVKWQREREEATQHVLDNLRKDLEHAEARVKELEEVVRRIESTVEEACATGQWYFKVAQVFIPLRNAAMSVLEGDKHD